MQLYASCFASQETHEQLANININDVQSFIKQCYPESDSADIKEIKIAQNDAKIFLVSKDNEELIVKVKTNDNSDAVKYRHIVSELRTAKHVLEIIEKNHDINIPVTAPYKYGFFDKNNNSFVEVNDIQNFDTSKFDYYKQKPELICFQLMKKAKGVLLAYHEKLKWDTPEFGHFLAEYGKSLGILHQYNISHGDTFKGNNIFYDDKEVTFIDISTDPYDDEKKVCSDIYDADNSIDIKSYISDKAYDLKGRFNDYIAYLNSWAIHKKLFIETYETFSNNKINSCIEISAKLSESISKCAGSLNEDTECNFIMVLPDEISDKSLNSDKISRKIKNQIDGIVDKNAYFKNKQDVCFIVKIGEQQYEIYRHFHSTWKTDCIVKYNSDDKESIKKLLEKLSPIKQSECKDENIPGLWQTIKSLHGYTDESIITIEKKKQLAKTYKKIVRTLISKLYSKNEVQEKIKVLNDRQYKTRSPHNSDSKPIAQFDFCTQILTCSEYSDEEISQLIKENSTSFFEGYNGYGKDWILYI